MDDATHDPATHDPAPVPLELVTLSWERIQVRLRARPVVRPAFDPATVCLRRVARGAANDGAPAGDDGAVMPATRARLDDGLLDVRFNVMAGPGGLPLAPGRWRLEVDGRPAAIEGSLPDPASAIGRFALARGPYLVTPLVDGADRSLWLEVSQTLVDGSGPARRDAGTPFGRATRRIVGRLRAAGFRAMYVAARRVVRRDGHRILFSSDSRASLGGNLKVVHDRMVARGLDRQYDLRTLLKPSLAQRRGLVDRLRLPWLLASTDVILLDDYQPIIYRVDDPRTRIVQLWHASGAFKTVGYSRVGKPGGPSPYSRIHRNYTHAIVSSDLDVPFYAEAFGIPEASVVPTGIPRMDRFFDEAARAAGRAEALALFPAAEGRMTILFAPTFRGDTRTATYDLGRVDLAALHALAVQKDAVVIFKLHPFVRQRVRIPEPFRDRLFDGTDAPIDVNDLLFAVDLLITDYSSIVFEYSTLGRPMLFFAYDLDEYIAERDFYIPFEEFVPGRIVRSFEALLDAIRRDDYALERVAEFASRHFAHLDGRSTDRVIDQLVLAR